MRVSRSASYNDASTAGQGILAKIDGRCRRIAPTHSTRHKVGRAGAGGGRYAFGRAALAYLVAVVPIAAVVLAVPSLGIVGIWSGLLVWMSIRAVVNRRRAHVVLGSGG